MAILFLSVCSNKNIKLRVFFHLQRFVYFFPQSQSNTLSILSCFPRCFRQRGQYYIPTPGIPCGGLCRACSHFWRQAHISISQVSDACLNFENDLSLLRLTEAKISYVSPEVAFHLSYQKSSTYCSVYQPQCGILTNFLSHLLPSISYNTLFILMYLTKDCSNTLS